MPFVDGTDFSCGVLHGVYICQAKLPTIIPAFSDLQKKVRDVSSAMAQVRSDVPPNLTTLIIDGRVGPTTALGAQMVVAAFNRSVPVPAELGPLISTEKMSGETLIKLVAAQAPEINAYISDVITNHPEAMQALVIDKLITQVINPISLKTVAIVAGGALLIVGTVYAFRKMERQRAGLEDRSHLLPDSTEEDEEDDDEGTSASDG